MQTKQAPLATLRGVVKHYGGILALNELDLDVCAGQVLSLLGANGAGKSTTTGLLLGLLEADAGELRVFGGMPGTRAARLSIGAMLQSAAVPERLRVSEVLELTRSYYPNPLSSAECVAMAGLDGLLHRFYRALSGGQQRRLQFALAICGRPRLLCLDEPSAGLDVFGRQGLWDAVRALVAEGAGVLLTTHDLEEAEALSDRVVVLERGRCLIEGSVDAVRARVAQRRIRCRSALSAEQLAAWPGVLEAKREGAYLQLISADAETVLRRLLAADAGLDELEVRRAGLAEAFLELTTQPRQEAA